MPGSILVVTSTPFWDGGGGSKMRITSLIAALLDAGRAVVIGFVGRVGAEQLAAIERCGCGRAEIRCSGFGPAYPGVNAGLGAFESERVRRFVHDLIEIARPDAVVVEYLRLAYTVDGLGANRPLLAIDTHDVMHQRCERFAAMGLDHWISIDRATEAAALAAFDIVIAIQNEDAAVFADMAGGDRVVTATHCSGVTPLPPRASDGTIRVGFLGAGSGPNADGIEWFVREVWPGVLRSAPGPIALTIAGRVGEMLPDWIAGAAGVRAAGFVDDLRRFYAETDIVVGPVRVGGGLKIKNVEALSSGRPLVTTAVGAQGMEDSGGRAFVVADDADEFAAAVLRLASSEGERDSLGRAGAVYATEHFSREAAYGPLLKRLPPVLSGAEA